jgi:hypothetical protein
MDDVQEAVKHCSFASTDGQVFIQTDMRAHMNPTRMKVITELAEKMDNRLATLCPKCSCPGGGLLIMLKGYLVKIVG